MSYANKNRIFENIRSLNIKALRIQNSTSLSLPDKLTLFDSKISVTIDE